MKLKFKNYKNLINRRLFFEKKCPALDKNKTKSKKKPYL